MNVVCYSRVSSLTQDLELQNTELKKFCDYRNYKIVRFFSDKQSGKDMNRVGFQDMINLLDKNTLGVEAVVIYKLDRIGRSLSDLLKIVDFFKLRNIQLISINDNIDTGSAQGVLFFQLIGAFSEYERALIRDRTTAGKNAAIEAGVKFGRPEVKMPIDLIKKDMLMGVPKSVICRKYGVKRSTLYTKLKDSHKDDIKL